MKISSIPVFNPFSQILLLQYEKNGYKLGMYLPHMWPTSVIFGYGCLGPTILIKWLYLITFYLYSCSSPIEILYNQKLFLWNWNFVQVEASMSFCLRCWSQNDWNFVQLVALWSNWNFCQLFSLLLTPSILQIGSSFVVKLNFFSVCH